MLMNSDFILKQAEVDLRSGSGPRRRPTARPTRPAACADRLHRIVANAWDLAYQRPVGRDELRRRRRVRRGRLATATTPSWPP